MPQLGELPPPDLLTRKQAREEQVDNGRLMIHAAGGDAEDGDHFGLRIAG